MTQQDVVEVTKRTYTAYLLMEIKRKMKDIAEINDISYTLDGIEGTLTDALDKQLYKITITPLYQTEGVPHG